MRNQLDTVELVADAASQTEIKVGGSRALYRLSSGIMQAECLSLAKSLTLFAPSCDCSRHYVLAVQNLAETCFPVDVQPDPISATMFSNFQFQLPELASLLSLLF